MSFLPSGENALKELIENADSPKGHRKNVDEIKNIVTAENLCSCRDPIMMAFKVITTTIRSLSND